MKKILLVLVVVGVLSGGWYFYMRTPMDAQLSVGDATATTTVSSATSTISGPTGKHAVSWSFEQMGEDPASGAPMTKVMLMWDGGSYEAGTYMGSCAELDGTNGTLEVNEVSGVLCWWAGAGDEVGVFNEGGAFVLKHGEQQEPSAESQGFRGNFKTLRPL